MARPPTTPPAGALAASTFNPPELWLAPRVDATATREQLRDALAKAMAQTDGDKRVLHARLEMACRVPVRRAWFTGEPEPLRALVNDAAHSDGVCKLPVQCGMLAMHLFAHALETKELPALGEASASADGGNAYVELLELALELDMEWLAHSAVGHVLRCLRQMGHGACCRLLELATSPRVLARSYDLRKLVCQAMWQSHVEKPFSIQINSLLHAPGTLALGARAFGQLFELLPADVLDAQPDATSPPLNLEVGAVDWCDLDFAAVVDDLGKTCRWKLRLKSSMNADLHCIGIGAYLAPLNLRRPVSAEFCFTARGSSGERTASSGMVNVEAWNAAYNGVPDWGFEHAWTVAALRNRGVLNADDDVVQLTVTVRRPCTSLQLDAIAQWLAHRRGVPSAVAKGPCAPQLCRLLAAAAAQPDDPSVLDSTIGEVLLRRAAHAITSLHTLPAYSELPRAALERLVARTDLHAEDEEAVVCALAPWMLANAEEDAAAVLAALDLAQLSFTQLERLIDTGGALHAVCERHQAVRARLKTELATRMRRVSGAHAPLPEELVCPITLELFDEAVVLFGDGHTYSKVAVEHWLWRCGPTPRSPLTNQRIDSAALQPNWTVRKLVDKYRAEHGRAAKRQRLDEGGGAQPSAALVAAPEHAAIVGGATSAAARTASEIDAVAKVMALMAGWQGEH